MGLTAYLSIELSCSFSHWFIPKASQLTLEPFQYLCHHPQESVYVSLPLDTHPFVFLRYRDCIPDNSYDSLSLFYVNKYVDHHVFEFTG